VILSLCLHWTLLQDRHHLAVIFIAERIGRGAIHEVSLPDSDFTSCLAF
jgi:hypothetical protein